jgi:uncharacterized protein
MMTLQMQNRLRDYVTPLAATARVTDVRIGLGYTAVRLASGQAGVAWTPGAASASCTHFPAAGTLAGRPATELLDYLVDDSSLARAVGLATANALLAALPQPPASRDEVISTLQLTPADRVVMLGYFAPVITRIRQRGCHLDIVELHTEYADTLNQEQGLAALAQCSVAIITATTLVNGTADEVLADLGQTRAAVLLGPSTPLCPAVFAGTRITHLAGSRVRDPEAVLRVVSEGGGTKLMRPSLDFETVLLAGC